jgi:hypothetical protein
MRPMLEEFLTILGLHQPGTAMDFRRVLEPFNDWVEAQDVTEEDRYFLASRLGAFICEYLIETCSAERVIKNGRIWIRLPIEEGVQKEFEPYAVAVGMTEKRMSLKEFLDALCPQSGRSPWDR